MDNSKYIARIMDVNKRNPKVWEYLWYEDTLYDHFVTAYTNICKNEEIQILQDQLSVMGLSSIAQSAILCLTVYEDCGYMIDSDLDDLKLLVTLGDQRAILMHQACRIMKGLNG